MAKLPKISVFVVILLIVSGISCSDDPTLDPIKDGNVPVNHFSGVFISRGPGMDNSITYIVPDVSPYRQTTKHLFSSITIKDLADKSFIHAIHSVETPNVSLGKDQYLRMLYHEISSESKWVVLRPGILDGVLALRATKRDAALDKNLLSDEENWFIIHDFSDDDDYRWVIIESLKHRGHYLMNEGTFANANALRLMKREDKRDATRWEIHKP